MQGTQYAPRESILCMEHFVAVHVALPACNRGATGSYRDITVNNLGNTGVYQHEPWLHRAAP